MEKDAMCYDCQMWWHNVMWNMVWCEMYCDVECGCGVQSTRNGGDVDSGCAMSNTLCFEMWWCEMVVGCRLRRNVMPDVEYGGPRRDVAWNMYVVRYVEWWRDVEWCRESWCDVMKCENV